MGQLWPYRERDINEMGGNGGKPDKGPGASPRGRGYHPGRSCSYEAAVIVSAAVVAVRAAVLASRFARGWRRGRA